MDLEDLAAAFVAGTLPHEEWTHSAHLAVGLWHVDRYGAEDALARLRAGIRRLNDRHGTVNSETSGYHETITRAYVQLLAQHDERYGELPLVERVARLLESALAGKDALFTFYSRQTLMSTEARRSWVEPDLAPLLLTSLDA